MLTRKLLQVPFQHLNLLTKLFHPCSDPLSGGLGSPAFHLQRAGDIGSGDRVGRISRQLGVYGLDCHTDDPAVHDWRDFHVPSGGIDEQAFSRTWRLWSLGVSMPRRTFRVRVDVQ